jgi:single-stranded DNA-binding protein
MSEYKNYDPQDTFTIHNARLAKPADVRDTEKGKMVKLTFVSTSRSETDSDLWVECTVSDRQTDLAAFLQKGDVIGISGKPCLRRFGDNNEKFAFNLRRAEIFPSVDLFVALKERGFTPGTAGKAPQKTTGLSARALNTYVPPKKLPPKKPARVIHDLDEDLPAGE